MCQTLREGTWIISSKHCKTSLICRWFIVKVWWWCSKGKKGFYCILTHEFSWITNVSTHKTLGNRKMLYFWGRGSKSCNAKISKLIHPWFILKVWWWRILGKRILVWPDMWILMTNEYTHKTWGYREVSYFGKGDSKCFIPSISECLWLIHPKFW